MIGVMMRFAAFVGVLSLASGCGAGEPGQEADTTIHKTAEMQALLKGTLHGDPERRCMWVGEKDSGVSILWPSNVTIERDPLRLVDTQSGETIARAGDAVRITGGSSPQPPPAEPTCRISANVFIAHQVERE